MITASRLWSINGSIRNMRSSTNPRTIRLFALFLLLQAHNCEFCFQNFVNKYSFANIQIHKYTNTALVKVALHIGLRYAMFF